MVFQYEPKLKEYMEKTGKQNIIVEVCSVESDFSYTELHIHFADDKLAESFVTRKRYRRIPTDQGFVFLPSYVLEYDDVITFGLKTILFYHKITQSGIRL